MKIFKYRIENGKATFPKDAHILRVDRVDDDFYKGDFLWAIVDPEWECVEQKIPKAPTINTYSHYHHEPAQLAVAEKQTLRLQGEPYFAYDEGGKLYVMHSRGISPENIPITIDKATPKITLSTVR